MTWLDDQVQAAAASMGDLIDTSPRLHRFQPEDLPAGLDALALMMSDAAVLQWMANGSQVCRHLHGRGPQPTFILLYDPDLARCAGCAAVRDMAIRGTDEDFTCDACGVTDRSVEYYPLGTVKGYVTITGGICVRCHDRVVVASS